MGGANRAIQWPQKRETAECSIEIEPYSLLLLELRFICRYINVRSPNSMVIACILVLSCQVSFGVHDSQEDAARQYDRALIIEKGELAKTNFPVQDYVEEIKVYVEYLIQM